MAKTAIQLRDAVVASFLGEVGYTSGNFNYSKYGLEETWRSDFISGVNEWQGLYCARSYSWNFDKVLGWEAGRAAIGLQGYALPVGWAATWLFHEWFLENKCHVGFENSQPGDAFLYKLPGRQTNPTNHIGMFWKWHIPGKIAIVIEGNLPNPVIGTTSSIGVHLHYRDITYVVAVHRPKWSDAAEVYNRNFPNPPEEEEELMTDKQYETLLAAINSSRGESLTFHQRETAQLDTVIEKQADLRDGINVVGRVAAEGRDRTPTAKEIIDALLVTPIQGFSFEWWLRQGLIVNQDHKKFPADKGSLAYWIMEAARELSGTSGVYTPEGYVSLDPIKSEAHKENEDDEA